ncbi:MAG TPA: DUF3108 domain-containing protein [Thermodesulfovibrionales bacterium]|nr:DUF3108 domain-containing protein [Thermodesulfovibrionales bacterium]
MESLKKMRAEPVRTEGYAAFPGRSGLRLSVCIIVLLSVVSAGTSFAFVIPEKLVYDLTWTGVKAGTATLEVVNDMDTIRMISTARSANWVSVFYTVEDHVETVLAKGKSSVFIAQPRNYRMKIREGRHRRDKEIIYDHAQKKAIFIDHLDNDRKEVAITERTFDPLSVLYYVRTLKLDVGKSQYMDIFDSKKLWNVEVQVLRKERISSVLGEVDTVVIKPLLKSEGIFNRKGDMLIWLTDDQKKIPVRMQTKVAVGAITATLVAGSY